VNHRKFDSWAMGCLLYEMLGEPHPFFRHGPDGNEPLEGDWPTDNPQLPPGYEQLQEVGDRLLERDPRTRISPPAAVALVESLLWPLPPCSTPLERSEALLEMAVPLADDLLCEKAHTPVK
jgi:serine/threonine protein kinase